MNARVFSGPFPALILMILLLASCSTTLRTVAWNIPDVDDYKKFPGRKVSRGSEVSTIHESCHAGIRPLDDWAIGRQYKAGMTEQKFFRKTGTLAFLVLKHDTLLYEYYAKGYDPRSIFTSFSMVKAYVSTLAGFAIEEGYIDSMDQKASDFLPELKKEGLDKITIRHLLQMTSGIRTNESYANPFSTSVKMYYSRDVNRNLSRLELASNPGARYKYQNINTQLLALILERTTGKPISKYLEEKIWKPLGMESDATWSLDHPDGEEKAFCCLNARARDFARFGILMADSGRWKGEQLVPLLYMQELLRPDTLGEKQQRYRMQWYTSAENIDYYGEGLLGQFTYVCPSKDIVIVRLGKGVRPNVKWYSMFKFIAGIEEKPKPICLTSEEMKAYEGVYEFGLSSIGDVSMRGEKVEVRATPRGLRVKTEVYAPFFAYPSAYNSFYNVRNSRQLTFYRDGDQGVVRMKWYRRGNTWELNKIAP